MLLVGILFICSVVTFSAFTLYAYTSNNNVPVFSDIVEKLEQNYITKESMQGEFIEAIEMMKDPNSLAHTTNFSADIQVKVNAEYEGINLGIVSSSNIRVDNRSKSAEMVIPLKIDVGGLRFGLDMTILSFTELESSETFFKLSNLPSVIVSSMPELEALEDQWIHQTVSSGEIGYSNNGVMNTEMIEALSTFIRSDNFKNSLIRKPDRVFESVRTRCISMQLGNTPLENFLVQYLSNSDPLIEEHLPKDLTVSYDICYGRVEEFPYYDLIQISGESIDATITVSNYNYSDEIQIEKPAEYVDIEDLGLEIPTEI